MNQYFVYLFLCIVFNTTLAVSYKLAVNKKYSFQNILVIAYFIACLMPVYNLFNGNHESLINIRISSIGIIAGILTFSAAILFIKSLEFEKLHLSWMVRSLSVAIPIAASILFWHEQITLKKGIGFSMLFLCILFVAIDKKKKKG